MVAVGDSLTQGVGDPTGNGGYIGILEEIIEDTSSAPSFEIKNYGKRGNRTDQLLKRLDEPKLSLDLKDADVVLITIGANDIMKVVKGNFTQLTYEAFFQETDDYRDRLEDIFEKIRSKNEGAPIYLVGVFNPFNMYFSNIPELDKIVEDWNAMGRETVEEYEDATFVPIHDLFENVGESYYADDHFHPNRRGYALMAERVFHYLEPELTEKQSELAENEETEQHVGQN
nr:SGNH/GDSL hydrolase family protein [Bacillus piscicola]